MQDFGSGDTSSNLVGGIQTKSENFIGIFSHALSSLDMSTPTLTQSEIFATVEPGYSNHAIAFSPASEMQEVLSEVEG